MYILEYNDEADNLHLSQSCEPLACSLNDII